MSKIYTFSEGKYREIDNLNALVRMQGSLIVIEDAEVLNHMEIVNQNHNNYIFIILNGNEKNLLKTFKEKNIRIKPHKLFVISKDTEEKYFNDLPNLLPYINKWDSNVANMLQRIKEETRNFFNNYVCNLGY